MHAIDCKMNYEMRIERVSNVPVVHLDLVFVRPLRQDYVLETVARQTVSDTFFISHISTIIVPLVALGKRDAQNKRSTEFLE